MVSASASSVSASDESTRRVLASQRRSRSKPLVPPAWNLAGHLCRVASPTPVLPGHLSHRDTVLAVEPQDLAPLLGIEHLYTVAAAGVGQLWGLCHGQGPVDRGHRWV